MKHATALDLHAQADLLARLGLHARAKRDDRGRMRRMIAVLLNTIPAPLLVLDGELRILAVSHAFCRMFDIRRQDALGRLLGELDSGRWDIPALKARLQGIRPLGNDPEALEMRLGTPRMIDGDGAAFGKSENQGGTGRGLAKRRSSTMQASVARSVTQRLHLSELMIRNS